MHKVCSIFLILLICCTTLQAEPTIPNPPLTNEMIYEMGFSPQIDKNCLGMNTYVLLKLIDPCNTYTIDDCIEGCTDKTGKHTLSQLYEWLSSITPYADLVLLTDFDLDYCIEQLQTDNVCLVGVPSDIDDYLPYEFSSRDSYHALALIEYYETDDTFLVFDTNLTTLFKIPTKAFIQHWRNPYMITFNVTKAKEDRFKSIIKPIPLVFQVLKFSNRDLYNTEE